MTGPHAEVGTIHPMAVPVILRTADEIEVSTTAPTVDALRLQRPLLDGVLRIVGRGGKKDGAEMLPIPSG